jgi:predicted transcriptional regulator
MNRKSTHCLTLRLDPQLDELVTEAAYDHRASKSDWIRMAIRQRLRLDFAEPQNQHPSVGNRVQERIK